MWFFCDASAAKGRGCVGSQWYPAGKRVWGTAYPIMPYCIPSTYPLSRFLRMTARTAEIAARRSSGSEARYSGTVAALDCMAERSRGVRGESREAPLHQLALSSSDSDELTSSTHPAS